MDEKTGFKTRSILAVPMNRHGKKIGVIEVLNKRSKPCFTGDDQAILELLAHQAAIAIENSMLYRENINKTQLASLGEGISGAAHCIKNIVGILELGASSIDYALEKNDFQMIKDSWLPLQQGCKRISELVMDMLSYAKNRTPEPEPVEIRSFLDGIVAMVSPSCSEKNVSIVHISESDAEAVMIDKNAIHRCMMNFISNAVDALEGRENASIVIRSCKCKEPDATEIRIEDNGAGIPEDTLQNIFDVFYSTKGSRGTGLGLSTTKKIVEEHGGSVTVSSTDGKGTTFSVRLPAQ
jgi:signal transduction histidine kinase